MKILLITQILVLLLLLILLCPIGGRVQYSRKGWLVQIKIFKFYITLIPRKKRKKKHKPKHARENNAPAKPKKAKPSIVQRIMNLASQYLEEDEGGSLHLIVQELPQILDILGDLVDKITIDELYLFYKFAGKNNAAGAAIAYGNTYSTGGIVLAILNNYFDIRKLTTNVQINFNASESTVFARIEFSINVLSSIRIMFRMLGKLVTIQRLRQNINSDNKDETK